MSKSYPYNILLTKDPTVIDKIYFDKISNVASFSSRLSALSPDQLSKSLVVSPKNSKDFISLDINFPQGNSGQGASKYVTLKLLETSRLLEYFNVLTSPFENAIITKAKVDQALTGDKELLKKLFAASRSRFYLSYGMGDDTSNWTGPYILELIDINISITSDGVRQMELMFTPNVETLSVFTNKVFNDYQYAQADSIFDTTAKQEKLINTSYNYALDTETETASEPKEDWNFIIRDLVSRFISDRFPTVPLRNVLTLLPDDFNYLTKDSLNAKNTKEQKASRNRRNDRTVPIDINYDKPLKNLGISIELDYTNYKGISDAQKAAKKKYERAQDVLNPTPVPSATIDTETTEKVINARSSELSKLREELKDASNDHKKARSLKLGNLIAGTSRTLFEKEALDNKINSLDAKISDLKQKIEDLEEKTTISTTLNTSPDQKLDTSKANENTEAAVTTYDPNAIAEAFPLFTAKDLKEFKLMLGKNSTDNDENTKEPNINLLKSLDPLYTFVKALNRSNEQFSTFTIIEENDYRVTSLLEKHGLIEDKNSTVVLFGRKDHIQSLIYPSQGQTTIPDPRKRSNIVQGKYDYWQEARGINRARRYILAKRGQKSSDNPSLGSVITRDIMAKLQLTNHPLYESHIGYLKDFKNTFKPKYRRTTSSFNEGLGAYEKDVSVIEEGTKDPVIFTHNISDPNVISLSFDSSPYKAHLLSRSTESVYRLIDQSIKGNQLLKDNELIPEDVRAIIDMFSRNVQGNRKKENAPKSLNILDVLKGTVGMDVVQLRLLPAASAALASMDSRDFLDYVFIKANTKSSITVPTENRVKEEMNIINTMNKYIYNVNIKTLPFFNIPSFVGRDCILFGKPSTIIGSKQLNEVLSKNPAFYTGKYQIVSYKHRISSSDAYSEFSLLKKQDQVNNFKGMNVLQLFDYLVKKEFIDDKLRKEEAEKKKENK